MHVGQIVNVKKCDGTYKDVDSEKLVTILGLECRGIVPTKWIPGEDFNVRSLGGKFFENADITELDWGKYTR